MRPQHIDLPPAFAGIGLGQALSDGEGRRGRDVSAPAPVALRDLMRRRPIFSTTREITLPMALPGSAGQALGDGGGASSRLVRFQRAGPVDLSDLGRRRPVRTTPRDHAPSALRDRPGQGTLGDADEVVAVGFQRDRQTVPCATWSRRSFATTPRDHAAIRRLQGLAGARPLS